MRLAAKLGCAFAVVVALGLILQATIHHRRMSELHAQETRDDLFVLARAIQGGVTTIWERAGAEAARVYVERANDRRAATQIRLRLDERRPPGEPTAPFSLEGELVAIAPVTIAGEPRGTVELRRSLRTEARFRKQLVRTQAMLTVVIVVALSGLSLLVGYLFVGRATRLLVGQLGRIAEGDYGAAPAATQRDEMGQIARAVNELAASLRRARQSEGEQRRARAAALEQLRHADRLATVGKLASGIAHELGTPINVVAGRASMIAEDGDATPEQRKNAEIIQERADHMATIIRQLLTFSRRGLRKTTTTVHGLLVQAKTLIEPLAEENEVRVTLSFDDRDLVADIDAGKALQVLTNLMVNGVQAMSNGGELTIGAGLEQVDEPPDQRSEPGRYVYMFVQDQGIGIPAELLERVFDPFFTTKPADEGSGLGLSVSHGLAREHGGWMDVQSNPGQGSRFAVYLPQGDVV